MRWFHIYTSNTSITSNWGDFCTNIIMAHISKLCFYLKSKNIFYHFSFRFFFRGRGKFLHFFLLRFELYNSWTLQKNNMSTFEGILIFIFILYKFLVFKGGRVKFLHYFASMIKWFFFFFKHLHWGEHFLKKYF